MCIFSVPRNDSFFLVETSGRDWFNLKELCTLESVARHNQGNQVNMVVTANVGKQISL